MKLLDEFKAFIARGNVVDLAVGVVIGAAFGRIVSSLVDGLIMPTIAVLGGGVRVEDWKVVLRPARLDAAGREVAAEVALRYGAVLQAAIDFVLIAAVIFLFLRAYNRLRQPAAAEPPKPAEDIVLLREIRDLLRAQREPQKP